MSIFARPAGSLFTSSNEFCIQNKYSWLGRRNLILAQYRHLSLLSVRPSCFPAQQMRCVFFLLRLPLRRLRLASSAALLHGFSRHSRSLSIEETSLLTYRNIELWEADRGHLISVVSYSIIGIYLRHINLGSSSKRHFRNSYLRSLPKVSL